jgi:hypothetical protein
MVIVANKAIFGGEGPYSAKGSKMLRMVGRRTWAVSQIRVKSLKGVKGKVEQVEGLGVFHRNIHPPYMPAQITEPYHPGGNSLCYTIQTAHLMGCDPIYALAFTLKSGTGHFHGLTNPATKVRSVYDATRALDWLKWYEASFPRRVRLLPEWEGPIYDVFKTETIDDYKRTLERGSLEERGRPNESDAVADGWSASPLW